jgi:YD repeat-containing protein
MAGWATPSPGSGRRLRAGHERLQRAAFAGGLQGGDDDADVTQTVVAVGWRAVPSRKDLENSISSGAKLFGPFELALRELVADSQCRFLRGFVFLSQTLFTYDPATTLLASVTDSLGRVTTYAYDANGNMISTTALAGTAAAVTTSYTYNAFGDVLTSTDPLQRTSTFVYGDLGDLLEVHDPLGNVTTMTYDGQGLMQSVTNALGQTVTLGYDGPDLRSMTDPLGRTAKGFHDAAGRLRSVSNALGQRSLLTYDGAGRLLEADDPMGNSVKFGYDVNGNMISSWA